MTSTETAHPAPRPSDPGSPLPWAAGGEDPPVFVAAAGGVDRLDRAPAARLLAEVAVHRGSETPLAVGIFGPAGSGKSRFLRDIVGDVSRLSAAAGAATPFLPRTVVAHVTAVPGREPASLLAGAVLEAVAQDHAGAAEDALQAGGDPREAVRRAGERVNALRGALDAERQTLAGIEARRARLADVILFDAAGSRVDAFARAHRGRIEARLRAFGLPAQDPIRSYKELVRDAAETGGGGSQAGLARRALWGFRGQGMLLGLALALAALAWSAGLGAADPDGVSAWLAGFGDRFAAVTDWARAHLELLHPASRIAGALAALALLALLVRAGRFLGPVFRGVSLFRADVAARRRELDELLAHQTRRVDTLAADAESAARSADAAQRRIETGRRRSPRGGGLPDHATALAGDLFGLASTPDIAAEGFFAALGDAVTAAGHGAAGAEAAPGRVIVAADGLDRLSPAEAAAFLAAAQRLLGRPGFALFVALERDQVAAALGEFDPALAWARLDRALQLSYDLGAAPPDAASLAERLLAPRGRETSPAAPTDASRSTLDRPFAPFEAGLVRTLAPFAGGTPRSVERFVNAYRVARADPRLAGAAPLAFATLALGLALDGTGAGSELAALDHDLAGGQIPLDGASEVGRAFAVATSSVGLEAGPPREGDGRDMRRGLAVARSYSRRG